MCSHLLVSLDAMNYLLLLLVFLLSLGADTVRASDPPLSIYQQGDDLSIVWTGRVQSTDDGIRVSGLPGPADATPVHYIPVVLSDDAGQVVRLDQVQSAPWHGDVPSSTAVQPGIAGTEPLWDIPDTLPDAPVQLVREGRLRGVRIGVVAVAPVFRQRGTLMAATHIAAQIQGAQPLTAPISEILSATTPFATGAAAPAMPAANGPAWRITVDRPGMQRVMTSALIAAGVAAQQVPLLEVRLGSTPVPRELEMVNGSVQAIRFYAPAVGDRWNATTNYWLTLTANPLTIASRTVPPDTNAPLCTTALERGIWRKSTFYDSRIAGPDGDHWFAAALRVVANSTSAQTQIDLPRTLPLADGPMTVTPGGSTWVGTRHQFKMSAGGQDASVIWQAPGNAFRADWSAQAILPNATGLSLQLVSGTSTSDISLDSVAWERPVQLDFAGRDGLFSSNGQACRFQMANVAADAVLYDVSVVGNPVRLAQTGPQWSDDTTRRTYLLARTSAMPQPAVAAAQPYDFTTPADALYIAPTTLHSVLAPLVAHRQAQGMQIRVIDVQAIYDGWSNGQVDPVAIRSFLRYAAQTWAHAPQAAVLVGDGTHDPRNYLGTNSPTLIPPYLAMVDRWVGETACETCFVQLDGDDPTSTDALPDMLIGRLPVKQADELRRLVQKIIGYETAPAVGVWRSRAMYIADNNRFADGGYDPAGDFFAFTENSATLQPRGVSIERLYYDPWLRDEQGNTIVDVWHESNATQARQRTIGMLNRGAGVVNFTGHGLQWRWAVTDVSQEDNAMLSLYDPDGLTNGATLPIVLEMTCLTSAFQTPAFSGTTIDERLVLHGTGGAIATWGPSGLELVYGHDALQRGFYRALWSGPPMQQRLGNLTAAGYLELFVSTDRSYMDPIQTFVLLGDPLTRARVQADTPVFLPVLRR